MTCLINSKSRPFKSAKKAAITLDEHLPFRKHLKNESVPLYDFQHAGCTEGNILFHNCIYFAKGAPLTRPIKPENQLWAKLKSWDSGSVEHRVHSWNWRSNYAWLSILHISFEHDWWIWRFRGVHRCVNEALVFWKRSHETVNSCCTQEMMICLADCSGYTAGQTRTGPN